MEHLDILDPNGSPTGQSKPDPDVHRDGDWHRIVWVWIINKKQELLIQKRSANMITYPNMWDSSAAGHITAGDDSLKSAVKETWEEIGVKIDPKKFELLFSVKHQTVHLGGTYFSNHWDDVYLVETDLNLSELQLQKEEVAEVKFINFRELENLIATKKIDFVDHHEELQKLFELLKQRYP